MATLELEKQSFVVFKYSEGKFFGNAWKHVVMTCDSEKLSLWGSGLSAPDPPKSIFFLSRSIFEKSLLRSWAVKVTDAESRAHVTFALISEDDFTRLKLFITLDGADNSFSTPKSHGHINTLDNSTASLDQTNLPGIVGNRTQTRQQGEVELFKLKNNRLTEIGKAIENLERSIDSQCKAAKKSWKATEMPVLEVKIKAAESQIRKLKEEAEKQLSKSYGDHQTNCDDFFRSIDDEMARLTEEYKALKVKYVLGSSPLSRIGIADFDAGLFIGYEDFYLEDIKGLLSIDLMPSSSANQHPYIRVVVNAPTCDVNPDAAFDIRFKVIGLKIKGDENSSIPTIKFNNAVFTFKVKIALMFLFDVQQNKWIEHPNQCNIQLVSFKGPYSNSLPIQTIFSYAVPGIKKGILAAIPPELGHFLVTLRSSFTLRIDFKICGSNITDLESNLDVSPLAQELCGLSPMHLKLFLALQKHSMKRQNIINSLSDFVVYLQSIRRHEESFLRLCALWEDACKIAADELRSNKLAYGHGAYRETSTAPDFHYDNFGSCFTKLVFGADKLLRKHLHVSLDWKEYRGEFALNRLLILFHRLDIASKKAQLKKAKSNLQKAQLDADIRSSYKGFAESVELYKNMSKNVDKVELTTALSLESGSNGTLRIDVRDIMAKLPVFLGMKLSQACVTLPYSKIPYSLHTIPHSNGDFSLQWMATGYIDDQFVNELDEDSEVPGAKHLPSTPVHSLALSTPLSYKHTYLKETFADISLSGTRDERIQQQRLYLDKVLSSQFISISRKVGEVYVRQPFFRAILDETKTILAGTELFEFSTNKVDKALDEASKLSGELLLPADLKEYRDSIVDTLKSYHKDSSLSDDDKPEKSRSDVTFADTDHLNSDLGCFNFIATAPSIKFLSTVPEVHIQLDLLSWYRVTNAFFEDIHVLKDWLAFARGVEVSVDSLALFQVYFTRFAKLIFSEGLHINSNLHLQLFKDGNEIVLKIDTPLPSSLSNSESVPPMGNPKQNHQSFFKAEFDFNYNDIIDDLEIGAQAAAEIETEIEMRTSNFREALS